VSVECFGMSSPEDALLESKRKQLEEKLREVDERLRSEMLARGFDPAQQDNLALTGPLAKLYIERENLQAELEMLPGSR
jgi:predicted  nucleic acid-binding Zn-ribbon protein